MAVWTRFTRVPYQVLRMGEHLEHLEQVGLTCPERQEYPQVLKKCYVAG